MSIKELYIIGIGLAIVIILSACSTDPLCTQNDDFPHQMPITFDTADSRAEMQNVTEMNQFSVWGWYQQSDRYTNIFDQTTVTNEDGWTYQDIKYWMENHLHHFYAIYPVSSISHATCTHLGYINIINFDASATNDDAVDLMIAQSTNLFPNQGEVVSLIFHHILSRIYISARTDQKNIVITSITVNGARTHGDYSMNDWHTDTYPIDTYGSRNTSSLSTDERILLRVLAIPQDINQLDLTIYYNRGGEEKSGHIRLNDVKWTSGYSYKYMLTLNDDDILLNTTIDNSQKWQDGGDSVIEFN